MPKAEFEPLWFLAQKVESISYGTPGHPTSRCELSVVLMANKGTSTNESSIEMIEKMRAIVTEYDKIVNSIS